MFQQYMLIYGKSIKMLSILMKILSMHLNQKVRKIFSLQLNNTGLSLKIGLEVFTPSAGAMLEILIHGCRYLIVHIRTVAMHRKSNFTGAYCLASVLTRPLLCIST